MARPAKREQDRLQQGFRFRANETDSLTIRARAAAAGMDVSDYLRQSALTSRVTVRKDRIGPETLLALTRIGTNLNQLARRANTEGIVLPAEVAETAAEIRQIIREGIDQALTTGGR